MTTESHTTELGGGFDANTAPNTTWATQSEPTPTAGSDAPQENSVSANEWHNSQGAPEAASTPNPHGAPTQGGAPQGDAGQPVPSAGPAYVAPPQAPVYAAPQAPMYTSPQAPLYAAPQPQQPHQQPAPGKNSYGFGIASFIIGIASIVSGWTVIAPVVGLVLGIIALRRNTSERTLTLWGVWLNGIMLAIAALGIMILIGFIALGLFSGVVGALAF